MEWLEVVADTDTHRDAILIEPTTCTTVTYT